MSAPVHKTGDRPPQMPTMYAPPWAREAAVEAADNTLAANEELRRSLPRAPLLKERRFGGKPFEGDLAIVRLRERPLLEPVVMPPLSTHGASVGVLARVVGAIGLAALAAVFMAGTAPLKGTVKADGEATLPWSRFVGSVADVRERPSHPAEEPVAALADRFAAASDLLPVRAVQTTPVPVAAMQPAQPVATEPRLRALDRDEIATLYRRSEELIGQGDIAGARLLLTRAAEAGDARSALALGTTYDAASLAELGVRGIAPDAVQARAWYAKAVEFGSGEASRRLEQLAQSTR